MVLKIFRKRKVDLGLLSGSTVLHARHIFRGASVNLTFHTKKKV